MCTLTSTCGHFSHGLSLLKERLCIGLAKKIAPSVHGKTHIAKAALSHFIAIVMNGKCQTFDGPNRFSSDEHVSFL